MAGKDGDGKSAEVNNKENINPNTNINTNANTSNINTDTVGEKKMVMKCMTDDKYLGKRNRDDIGLHWSQDLGSVKKAFSFALGDDPVEYGDDGAIKLLNFHTGSYHLGDKDFTRHLTDHTNITDAISHPNYHFDDAYLLPSDNMLLELLPGSDRSMFVEDRRESAYEVHEDDRFLNWESALTQLHLSDADLLRSESSPMPHASTHDTERVWDACGGGECDTDDAESQIRRCSDDEIRRHYVKTIGRKMLDPDMEIGLLLWLRRVCMTRSYFPCDADITQQALRLSTHKKFKGSYGWLEKFFIRNSVFIKALLSAVGVSRDSIFGIATRTRLQSKANDESAKQRWSDVKKRQRVMKYN